MTQEISVIAPKFLQYLMDPEQEYDCYFLVGNTEISEPEKIGVVKKMLLAHSLVLRAELQESTMKEKGIVKVSDLFPETFKNLLRFVYGFDNTPTLCFDEADNLFYAAEKYMVTGLKSRLATRLTQLLSPDNICSLMNNPACYTELELKEAITDILQTETAQVLASPQFLDLVGPAFSRILEQEALSVPELELWKAALNWAKHKTGSEDPQVLRKQLADHSNNIRICSIPLEDFCGDVVTSNILTFKEVNSVCLSHGQKRKQDCLVDFSNMIKSRKRMFRLEKVNIDSTLQNFIFKPSSGYLNITTREMGLELLTFKFFANSLPINAAAAGYSCNCTITINHRYRPSNPQWARVVFQEQVEFDKDFEVPVVSDGQNVTLLPNTSYQILVQFTEPHMTCWSKSIVNSNNCHFSYDFSSLKHHDLGFNVYYSHIKRLSYRPCIGTK